jgi:hypothetical protein
MFAVLGVSSALIEFRNFSRFFFSFTRCLCLYALLFYLFRVHLSFRLPKEWQRCGRSPCFVSCFFFALGIKGVASARIVGDASWCVDSVVYTYGVQRAVSFPFQDSCTVSFSVVQSNEKRSWGLLCNGDCWWLVTKHQLALWLSVELYVIMVIPEENSIHSYTNALMLAAKSSKGEAFRAGYVAAHEEGRGSNAQH